VPALNPDGAELALAERPRHIRSSTRRYPFDEDPVEGLTVEDVDGDGRMLTMRIRDPHGAYKTHPTEPRLMVAREPGEYGGEYYRLMPEGTLAHWDGLTVRVNKDREGLDLNRNFPSHWRQEFEQAGAGPYPTSEPEVRAMVAFITGHRNIGAAVSFHTHSGVILRPMGTQSDEDMVPEDLWTYKRFSEIGEKLSGYPAISIFTTSSTTRRRSSPARRTGSTSTSARCSGTSSCGPEQGSRHHRLRLDHWYRDHPVEDDLKLLKWSDEQCGGQAYIDWQPFMHPQLGAVEIGGWDKMNFWRNPPPALREREAARFPAWLTQIALSLPKLEMLRTEVRALGPDTWRIRFAVANSGWLPAYVTQRALERKVVRGVMFEVHLPESPRCRSSMASTATKARNSKAMRRRRVSSLPAQPRRHRRPRGGGVGRACAQGHPRGPERARRPGRRRAWRGHAGLKSARRASPRDARRALPQRAVTRLPRRSCGARRPSARSWPHRPPRRGCA
jgi:murein tripeptide amidase MpaA